jgi:peptidoglycan/LPS O-acetylase OafA/YrhL
MLFGLLWSMVLFSCVAGVGALRKIFKNPLLRYLGFISFSAYLAHITVLNFVNIMFGSIPFKGWVMLMLTLLVSHISWVLIEKPTSRIRPLGKIA